jgi:hypothetical protein
MVHQVKEEWHNIKQSSIEVTEEMKGGKEKNREMKNGMMTNVQKP